MGTAENVFRHYTSKLAALAIIFFFYVLASPTVLDSMARQELAKPFRFTPIQLVEPNNIIFKTRRSVNPSLERHSAWISAVGAAVALFDLDGDGLSNDVCHVDPRTDLVTLAPVPGSGNRYALFSLSAQPHHYDSSVMAPMGCVPGDFNEDGYPDLFVYYWGRTPLLYINQNIGELALDGNQFRPIELTNSGERWFTNAATFADLDGDGHLDIVIGNYFQDGARILDAAAKTSESMHHSMSRAYNGGRNRVYLWQESNESTEVVYQEVEGLFSNDSSHAWTLAIGAADLNNDLLPELYYANDFGPDRLYLNVSSPGEPRVYSARREAAFGHPTFEGAGPGLLQRYGCRFCRCQ